MQLRKQSYQISDSLVDALATTGLLSNLVHLVVTHRGQHNSILSFGRFAQASNQASKCLASIAHRLTRKSDGEQKYVSGQYVRYEAGL